MRNKRTFEVKVVTDPQEAMRRVVYGAGALEACADVLGKSHQTISKQLNEEDGAGLRLRAAAAIVDFMESTALAECFAARAGGIFVKLPSLEPGASPELVSGFSSLVKEFSEVSAAFSDALADGSLSDSEVDRFEKELRDMYQAGERLVRAARSAATPTATVARIG